MAAVVVAPFAAPGAARAAADALSAASTAATPGLPSAIDTAPPITAHGGWTQHNPTVYLIFWGPQWTPADPVAIAEQTLFRQLPGSPYNALLGQYGVHNDVRLAGVWFDRSTPAVRSRLTLAGLLTEAQRARRAEHWRDDRNTQWLVLPQPGANLEAFPNECGEHDLLWSGGAPYVLTLIPPFEEALFSNCVYDYSSDDGTAPASLVNATTSLTSHEYAEAATDPTVGTGWVSGQKGSAIEIADLCYFYSATPAGLTVNVSYLWDDSLTSAVNGCTV